MICTPWYLVFCWMSIAVEFRIVTMKPFDYGRLHFRPLIRTKLPQGITRGRLGF